MKVSRLQIPEVILIEPTVYTDERGYFFESYKKKNLDGLVGRELEFVQDNYSKSKKGVLRGLHFQSKPHSQGKLVSVVSGSVFDVAVDVRENSPTYGRWVGENLSSENSKQLWIPPGFAHGFLAMSDSIVCYKCTNYYSPNFENIIRWDCPLINILWPSIDSDIILSDKDKMGKKLGVF